MSEPKQPIIDHVEKKETKDEVLTEEAVRGRDFTVTEDEMPKGYFYSLNFIGSMLAIGLSLSAGVAGFAIVAPILGAINADIGPSPNLIWVSLGYLLTTATFQVIVGRLTDIFGRRWFMIFGNALAVVGSIICAVAPHIEALIAGEVFLGIAASFQLCYAFAVAELVPVRWRFLAVGFTCFWLIPGSGLAPAIAYALTYRSSAGWRGVFYFLIGLNSLCTTLWFLFYRPPNFKMKHANARKIQFIAEFDYIGCALFILGMLLFLMGLAWGGTLHPWKSGHVIGTIIVGFFILVAFVLYEIYAPLKEPIMPIHFYKRKEWNVTIILWGLGATMYYANALLYPNMIATLYSDGRDIMWVGWASCIANSGIIFGEWLVPIGNYFPKRSRTISAAFAIGCAFIAAMASCTPETPTRAMVLMFLGSMFIGYQEIGCSVVSSFTIDDQREIGAALGLASSIRSAISSIGSAVFQTVLANRLSKTIPSRVPSALTEAGLSSDQVPAFITALSGGNSSAISSIPGMTPAIQQAGADAYQWANSDAYRTVWLVTLAFAGIGVVCSLFYGNVDHLITKDVSIQLHKKSDEEKLAGHA